MSLYSDTEARCRAAYAAEDGYGNADRPAETYVPFRDGFFAAAQAAQAAQAEIDRLQAVAERAITPEEIREGRPDA